MRRGRGGQKWILPLICSCSHRRIERIIPRHNWLWSLFHQLVHGSIPEKHHSASRQSLVPRIIVRPFCSSGFLEAKLPNIIVSCIRVVNQFFQRDLVSETSIHTRFMVGNKGLAPDICCRSYCSYRFCSCRRCCFCRRCCSCDVVLRDEMKLTRVRSCCFCVSPGCDITCSGSVADPIGESP